MTQSSWIFCISLASFVARSGYQRQTFMHQNNNTEIRVISFSPPFCWDRRGQTHLLAPWRLVALELLHVSSIEGVKSINEPLFVRVPQRLQHRMHQLWEQTQRWVCASLTSARTCTHGTHQLSKVVDALSQQPGQAQRERPFLLLCLYGGDKEDCAQQSASTREEHHFPSCLSPTWEVFDVYTAEVAQSILVVGGVVADDAIVLAGEVIEPAVDRRHAGQVIQHLLHLFNDFLETYRQQSELKQMHTHRVTINSLSEAYSKRTNTRLWQRNVDLNERK